VVPQQTRGNQSDEKQKNEGSRGKGEDPIITRKSEEVGQLLKKEKERWAYFSYAREKKLRTDAV